MSLVLKWVTWLELFGFEETLMDRISHSVYSLLLRVEGLIIILPECSMHGPNYVKWILEPHLKPVCEKAIKESESGDIEVMEDNSPCHAAKLSKEAHNRLQYPENPLASTVTRPEFYQKSLAHYQSLHQPTRSSYSLKPSSSERVG